MGTVQAPGPIKGQINRNASLDTCYRSTSTGTVTLKHIEFQSCSRLGESDIMQLQSTFGSAGPY